MIAAGTRSCVIALHSCPRGFALSLCLWFAELTSLFRRFIPLLLVQDCSGVIAPCSFHFIAVSSAVMPPRRTRNSLESSVPPAVSSAPLSTVSVSTNAVLTYVQASGSPASASISPEFLASVIQAIQTPISAIVQQSLSAMVGAHSVSQGLPAISAQGSSLLLVRLTWMHMAVINPGLHRLLLGFYRRLLRPVLVQYQWLRQQTYRQVLYVVVS